MKWVLSLWSGPSDDDFRAAGTWLLTSALVFGLALVVLSSWLGEDIVFFWPLVFLVPVAGILLFRRPLMNLAVVIGLFSVVATYEEGIQPAEVLYGLYYFSFLGHWFFTRLIQGERILLDPEDKAALLFVVGVTLSIPLTFLFGGEPRGLVSEWTALMLLAFYFPVKEACMRYENGAKVVVGALLFVGLVAAVRNMILYQSALSDAEMAWQVAHGRVYINDNVLMVTSLITLVVLTFARKARHVLPMGALFLLLFAGVILTQSRGFWIAFLFGAGVMFLLSEQGQKRRMLSIAAVAGTCVGLVMVVFFPQYVQLIVIGLADRLWSVGTALTEDLSMVNRLRESKVVLEEIVKNPILGYGMSVPYAFFDLPHMGTDRDAFVHNGYLGLWYKFGIWGLGLMVFVIYRAVRAGILASRLEGLDSNRILAFAAGVALIGLALAGNTSNPFFLMDGTLLMGVLPALASGGLRRSLLDREQEA